MKTYKVIFRESSYDGKTSKNTFKKTKHFKRKENAYKFAEKMQENALNEFSWTILLHDTNYQGRGYKFSEIIDCKESKNY